MMPATKSARYTLIAVVVAALLVRFAGIGYGLPLWVVGDEPTLIYGTLKMLELKTLIPSLHAAAIGSSFYYAPFLPYVYMGPFLAVIGAKWLVFPGTFEEFKLFLAADVSALFIVARIITALAGTALVWFIYVIAKKILHSDRASIAAAAAVAFSYLPMDLSHWARHWIPVTLLSAVAFYAVVNEKWPFRRQAEVALLAVILSIGISVQGALTGLFVLIRWLFFNRGEFFAAWRSWWWWRAISIGVAILVIEFLLWPRSFAFIFNAPEHAAATGKSFVGLLASFSFYGVNLWRMEAPLSLLAMAGVVGLWRFYRRFLAAASLFVVLYVVIIYAMVGTIDRYSMMAYPIFALLAGAGWDFLCGLRLAKHRTFRILLYVPWGVMLIAVLRFDFLLLKNDTRVQALQWAKNNISAETKVLTLAPFLRLPASRESIAELEAIDPGALRSVDRSERDLAPALRRGPILRALNAYTVASTTFFANITEYARKNGYDYVIADPEYLKEQGAADILNQATVVLQFSGTGGVSRGPGHQDIPDGFGGGLPEVLISPSLGPTIVVARLNK